jgi:anaerobic magnesium-protoporphyrin IX monomethyl ester cyclase
MPVTDCLIVGFFDYPFANYVEMARSMGAESGAYRDLALAFIEYAGQPMRALDILTHFFYEGRQSPERPFSNADFLWPVVAYLTVYLRRRGHNVEYVNLPHFERGKLRDILQAGTRTVAITTTLYVSPLPILALVELIRQYDPNAKIIIGGPHISNLTPGVKAEDLSRMFEYLGGDIYVLCPEGETTLERVLQALKQNDPLERVPNLAFKDASGQFRFTPQVAEENDLKENIIDYSSFEKKEVGELLSIRTAKSCPFACAFCGFPERAGRYMYLDVPEVEKLLDAIAKSGSVTTLTFLDDTFNVPKGRFKEILRLMARNKYGFKWNSFYRSDHGDAETIELMAQAGCEGVFLGLESGSDAMLTRMNKAARRKHYVTAIPLLRAAGISTYASLITGFPGETDDTVQETISLIEEAAPDFYRTQLWYADPVTPIWKERERYAVTGSGFNWSHKTMDAKQACDWIDRIFLVVQNSTWMPQFGFEQWSTFYLSRKGMTAQQIHTFVRCFNALIRHRMLHGRGSPPSQLMDNLRLSCQFDRPRRTSAESAPTLPILNQTMAQ